MALYGWLYRLILRIFATLRQGAADSVPHVKAWLKEACRVCFCDESRTTDALLAHGWFEAGMTVVVVAPQWEYFLLWRFGCRQWMLVYVLLYAGLFVTALPIPRHVSVPPSVVTVCLLRYAAAPWPWYVVVLLFNVRMSSLVLGTRIEMLWWEALKITERHWPTLEIKEEHKIDFEQCKKPKKMKWLYEPVTFARHSHLFGKARMRNRMCFGYTKILCFTQCFVPLFLLRFKLCFILEGFWGIAWWLAVEVLGFKPTLAGLLGGGGRATHVTDELLAAFAAYDAKYNAALA